MRRQVNYCQRHSVTVREVQRNEHSDETWAKLLADLDGVCRSTMSEKPQTGEVTFFDGTLRAHELGMRRLFIAESEHNGSRRIEGDVVCNPMRSGKG